MQKRSVIHIGGKQSWGWKVIMGLVLIAGCFLMAVAADSITGVARNQTRGQLATDDEVILLRLDQGMQEEARTRTNSQGWFTLKVRYPDQLHLVRVVHQGVNYDQRASAGEDVSIDVFDAAERVPGINGSIEIIRIEASENLLHVSDMIEIRNDSNPLRTQAGARAFETYLPAAAKIQIVLAAGSGKIGVKISAATVPGETGHYTVDFPLRPGATKFVFNYDLPYDGHATFQTKGVYPLQQLAVVIPPTMRFTSRSPSFQVLPTGNSRYLVEAADHVKAAERPGFEISGVGVLPSLQAQSSPKPPVATLPSPAPSVADSSGAHAHGANLLSEVPASGFSSSSSPLQWRILGASAVLVLGVCGFFLWRRAERSGNTMVPAARRAEPLERASASQVEALKGELSQLEVDRLHGTISGEEYDSAKRALEGMVRRVLTRAGVGR